MTNAPSSNSTKQTVDRPEQRIKDGVPPIYGDILPEWFESTIPVETNATCHDCAMLAENNACSATKNVSFSQRSKCCTFHPVIFNYMAGGLLNESSPNVEEGRRRIREMIKNRIGITPYGILPPAKHSYLYKTIGNSFGRAESLICPYYDDGNCTVYHFRESTCYTWFCKYVSGHDGMEFWRSMKSYIHHVERTLADYVTHTLGLNPRGMLRQGQGLTLDELENQPLPDDDYRKLWGEWHGREEEFYEETFRLVSALTRDEYERLEGFSGVLLLDEVKVKRTQMVSRKLPTHLKRNPQLEVEKIADDTYLVLVQPAVFQPIQLRRRMYEILDFFDGRSTTEETIQSICEQENVNVKQDLLIGLYQFRILIDAQPTKFSTKSD